MATPATAGGRTGVGMTAEEIVKVGTVAGAVVAGFLKGLPAVVRSLSTARRQKEADRRKVEDEAAAERCEAEARRDAEVFEMRQKLHTYSIREHACELKLTRALAWLAHLEAALKTAEIEYVPYNEGGRADSDPIAHGLPGDAPPPSGPPSGRLPRQTPPKKGKP